MANSQVKQPSWMRRILQRCFRLLAIVVITLAIVLASARLLLPMVGQYSDAVFELLSESIGRPISAQQVKTGIKGFSPQIELSHVELLDDSGARAAHVASAYLKIDLFQSIRDWELSVVQLRVVDPVVVVSQSDAGIWQIAGFELTTQEYGVDSKPRSSTFFAWLELLSGLQMENVTVDCTSCNQATIDRVRLPSVHLSVSDGVLDLRGSLEWRSTQQTPLIVRAKFASFCPADHSLVDISLTRIDVSRAGRNWHTKGNVLIALDALVPTVITGQVGYLDFGDTLNIASITLEDNTLSELLQNAQPRGKLSDLSLRYSMAARDSPALSISGKFAKLESQRWNDIPGIAGLSGKFNSDGRSVQIQLDSQDVLFDAPELFREKLSLDALTADLEWQITDSGWQLRLPKLDMSNADLSAGGTGAFDWFYDAQRSSELTLKFQFNDVNGARTSHYLPVGIMDSSLVEWLDYSIISAHIPTARLTFRGALVDFPFNQKDGEFNVSAKIENGKLIPTEAMNWPAIENINGELVFDRSRLSVTAATATTAGIPLQNVTATADVMADKTDMVVTGEAALDLPKHLAYINTSPLKEDLGPPLSVLSLAGVAHLKLGLNIPFDDRETQVDGNIKIKQATVGVIDDTLLFNQVKGTLRFDQNGFRPSELSSRFLDYPTHIELQSSNDGRDLLIEANGRFDDQSLKKAFDLSDLPIFEGQSEWLAKVRVEDKKTIVQIDSDLRGITLNLPEPLSKSADAANALRIKASIRENLAALRISLDDHQARLEFSLTPRLSLKRGRIGINKKVKALPKLGTLLIEVDSPLQASPWLSWFEQLPLTTNQDTTADPLNFLIKFEQLDIVGQSFKNTSVVWTPGTQDNGEANENWNALLDGPQVSGSVHYQAQAPNDLMTVKLSRLHLTTSEDSGENAAEPTTPKSTAPKIADIDMSIDNLVLDERRLGVLSLKLTQDERSDLHIRQLQLTNEHTQLHANLDSIHTDDGGLNSKIALSVSSENFGNALRTLGFEKTLDNGRGTAEINSQWPGSISDFSIENMAGDFNIKFKEAIFPAIEPGIGRLFGVLSVETLTRRLTLDFGDLIDQGFTVDRFEGYGVFAQGVLSIDKLRIRGPAADINLNGDTNMLTQQLYLDASVLPKITSSLPLAAALANPALGLAILFAQTTMGDELAKITQMDYRIRGLWSDPSATEVK